MYLPKRAYWSPQSLILDVTNNCNLRCIMCRPQLLKENSESWSFIDFLVATRNLAPRSASLGGTGEPLLNKSLGEMVEHLYVKGIKPILNTNGTMLSSAGAWLQKVHLMKVSMDAANEETYKTIRGNVGFQELLNNIRKVTRIHVCRVRLEYVVMSTNYREMLDFIKLAKELGVDGVFFRLYQGMDLPANLDEGFRKVPDLVYELHRTNKVAASLHVKSNLPDLCLKGGYIGERYACAAIHDDRRRRTCLVPWLQLFIRADGEASPCCDLSEVAHISVGNVFKEKNVWNSTKMQSLRTAFRRKDNYDLYAPCQACEFIDWHQLLKWTNLVFGWW